MLTNSDEKPWYKQFWPWFLIALPTVVIVACLFTAYLAIHNPLSLVNQDYYKEGLTINKNNAEIQRAKAWQIEAQIQMQEDHRIHILLKANADFVFPSLMTLQYDHPVNDKKDLSFIMDKEVVNKNTVSQGDRHEYVSGMLSTEKWQLLDAEKHWYVYLRSTANQIPVNENQRNESQNWILEGEGSQSSIHDFVLGAASR